MKPGRRKLLTLGALAPLVQLAPFTTPAFAAGATGERPAKLLVLVYLKGGNDSYNTLVPFADPRYARFRPTLALKREQLIHLSETQGLHPALKPLLPAWEARDLALVQGIGQQEITNQHYRDLEMQFTGAVPGQYYAEGWLSRALMANPALRAAPLDAIAFGDLDIREADPMGPFRGDRLNVVNMQHPAEWLAARSVSATQHLASRPAAEAARGFRQPGGATLRTAFPADPFGNALEAAALLAAAGLAPPVIHVTLNADSGDQHHAFDTHWDQLKYHGAALARLASGLAAFREAMRELGRWDDTLVATYDEFGRCPLENEARGTHHGWSSVHLVLGGRVRGGLMGQALPVVDVFALDGPPPVIDYRALYTAIIESWWGGSASGLFERRFKPLEILRA